MVRRENRQRDVARYVVVTEASRGIPWYPGTTGSVTQTAGREKTADGYVDERRIAQDR